MKYVIQCNGYMGIEEHPSIEAARAAANAEFGSRNSPTVRPASRNDIEWVEAMRGKLP